MALRPPLRPSAGAPSRGVVFPSPVVVLSILAVVAAALAFVLTRHDAPTERQVATPTAAEQTTSAGTRKPQVKPTSKPKPAPVVQRAKVYVEVFNNSGITGLAGQVGTQATSAGWKVVGTDNWYGSIPTNTVYFPQRLQDAGKQLALDLGIRRTAPAVGAMKPDRLTVILTAPLR